MIIKKWHKFTFWLILCLFLAYQWGHLFPNTFNEEVAPIVISEFLAVNKTTLADKAGNYPDWIELYNQTDYSVSLAGWSLSDTPTNPEKWLLPDITLAPQSYLLIFASGQDQQVISTTTELHASFKLKQEGGFLGLYAPTSRRFIDASTISYPPQRADISYGFATQSATYGYFKQATPRLPNTPQVTWLNQVAPLYFNPPHGFYQKPFSVTLTTNTPEATIRYTLDGSDPTLTTGMRYQHPITIKTTTTLKAAAFKNNYLSPIPATQTYLFINDILQQPATPVGFPPTWGTYPEDVETHTAGEPIMADYEMDPQIVQDLRYKDELPASLRTLPTLSLVTAPQHLDIYANPQARGVEWERPVSVELITPDAPEVGFQINAGLRIQGGKGRREYLPKHSFRLFFKTDYGASKLNYPLFPDSPVQTFDTLILRGGVNGSFAGVDQELATYSRDEWLRQSQIAMSGVGSHGIFVHLYLNGLYWGLYNLVERPDAAFSAAYLGGAKEDWYARNHSGPISGDGLRTEGIRYNFVHAATLAEQYTILEPYIDFEQFSDYLILNWYAGNTDWARKNWYSAIREPDGEVQYFVWDGEKTWTEGANIDFNDPENHQSFDIYPIFAALIAHPDFKMVLADRMYKHLYHNGVLTDEKSIIRWQTINQPLQQAIIAESARWGDARRVTPYTQADWLILDEGVLAQMPGNGAKLIELARTAGYYPLLDPPQFSQQGGPIGGGFTLDLATSQPDTTIYYTLDGGDPRAPGGSIAPQARLYQGPIILSTTVHLKTRAWREASWSALNEATFTDKQMGAGLVITEIMYNPPGGADYEFIELQNRGVNALDVSGMYFADGINYIFPPNTILAPQQMIVLAYNPARFAERYPDVVVAGTYSRKLANEGESLRLHDASGHLILSVMYDDEAGWPLSPDGRGDSLILREVEGNPDLPRTWQASPEQFGNPGRYP